MKNFKQLAFGLIVSALAIGFSSFTNKKQTNSNFFVYTSSLHTQTAIQTIGNYAADASDPCSGATTNVCGVTLSTAEPINSSPNASEFADAEDDLWSSQQNHSPADEVSMKAN